MTTYHLVTVTVTYKVNDAVSVDEAVSIVEHTLIPSREIDGVYLENTKDGFCSLINETGDGISCVSITEWGEQSE